MVLTFQTALFPTSLIHGTSRRCAVLPQIEEWQNRPLDDVYPVFYIDAIHYSVRDNGVIAKKAAYVILGLTCDGRKEVLSLAIGENESAKFWLNSLNELKNRGVKDVMIICSDGLAGIKEAITTAFPKTDCQRCMVRNTLKYVASNDMKSFAADLRTIYNAASEDEGQKVRARIKTFYRSLLNLQKGLHSLLQFLQIFSTVRQALSQSLRFGLHLLFISSTGSPPCIELIRHPSDA